MNRRSLLFKKIHQKEMGLSIFLRGLGIGSIESRDGECVASGNFSHAVGFHTHARGHYSSTEGLETGTISDSESGSVFEWRDGAFAHAEGHLTWAGGRASHAEGDTTITNNPAEHAQGRYNKSNYADGSYLGDRRNTQMSVGIGMNEFTRKNGFEIMQNGDVYIIGLGGYNGTNAGAEGVKPIQELLSSLNV